MKKEDIASSREQYIQQYLEGQKPLIPISRVNNAIGRFCGLLDESLINEFLISHSSSVFSLTKVTNNQKGEKLKSFKPSRLAALKISYAVDKIHSINNNDFETSSIPEKGENVLLDTGILLRANFGKLPEDFLAYLKSAPVYISQITVRELMYFYSQEYIPRYIRITDFIDQLIEGCIVSSGEYSKYYDFQFLSDEKEKYSDYELEKILLARSINAIILTDNINLCNKNDFRSCYIK